MNTRHFLFMTLLIIALVIYNGNAQTGSVCLKSSYCSHTCPSGYSCTGSATGSGVIDPLGLLCIFSPGSTILAEPLFYCVSTGTTNIPSSTSSTTTIPVNMLYTLTVYNCTTTSTAYIKGNVVTIGSPSACGGLPFVRWIGSGSGSYSGYNLIAQVTMNSNIIEYANYSKTLYICACGSCMTSNCACPSNCPAEEDAGCMVANNQRLRCTAPTAGPNIPLNTTTTFTSTSTTSTSTTTTIPFCSCNTCSYQSSCQCPSNCRAIQQGLCPETQFECVVSTIQTPSTNTYTLTVHNCTTTSTTTYAKDTGTIVSISSPSMCSGLPFVGWTGTGSGSYSGYSLTAQVMMNSNITEYANYEGTTTFTSTSTTTTIPSCACNTCNYQGSCMCPSNCPAYQQGLPCQATQFECVASTGQTSSTSSTTSSSTSTSTTSTLTTLSSYCSCGSCAVSCTCPSSCPPQINVICNPNSICLSTSSSSSTSTSTKTTTSTTTSATSTSTITYYSTTLYTTTIATTTTSTSTTTTLRYCTCGSCMTSNCACPSNCPAEEDSGCMPANNQRLRCGTTSTTTTSATSTSTIIYHYTTTYIYYSTTLYSTTSSTTTATTLTTTIGGGKTPIQNVAPSPSGTLTYQGAGYYYFSYKGLGIPGGTQYVDNPDYIATYNQDLLAGLLTPYTPS